MKCPFGISNFLEEISSLSHYVVVLYFFVLIAEEGLFLSLLAILWNSAFRCLYLSFSPLLFASLFLTAICKASSDSHFAFLHFLHPAVQGRQLGSAGAAAGRRRGGEQLPHVQGQEPQLRFAGVTMKRYPTSKVRDTQVRQ